MAPKATFAQRALDFYRRLVPPSVPRGRHVMNPYADPRILAYVRTFLTKYFSDDGERVLAFGINPGRFGAGLTGVTFTDPVALADECGIQNDLRRRREPSSIFVYDVINQLGGVRTFYRRVFLTAVSPLGFTRNGNNYNYYDDPALLRAVTPFIIQSIKQQIDIGGRRDRAIVFGTGQNFRCLSRLNDEHGFFQALYPLDHPRFIMQYRRKRLGDYLAKYEGTFRAALGELHATG